MNRIIKEYAGIIVVFVVSIVLLGVLFSISIRSKVSEAVTVENSMAYSDYADAVKQVVSKALPEIYFDNSLIIKRGNEVDFLAMFFVKHHGQEEYVKVSEFVSGQFEVKCIRNIAKEDITSLYHADTGKIIFPEAGIYQVTVCSTDSENRKTTVTISIPVTE